MTDALGWIIRLLRFEIGAERCFSIDNNVSIGQEDEQSDPAEGAFLPSHGLSAQ